MARCWNNLFNQFLALDLHSLVDCAVRIAKIFHWTHDRLKKTQTIINWKVLVLFFLVSMENPHCVPQMISKMNVWFGELAVVSMQPSHLWPTCCPNMFKKTINLLGVSRVGGGWLSLVGTPVLPTFNLRPASPRKETTLSIKIAASERVLANRRVSPANRKSNSRGRASPKSKPALPMWHLHLFVAMCKTEPNKRGFSTRLCCMPDFYREGLPVAQFSENFARLVEVRGTCNT